jgi:hypothetical protein
MASLHHADILRKRRKPGMAKVYLSSTLLDLKPEREAVTRWLIAAGHLPVHSYVADSESVHVSCLKDIDPCDLYVLILGHRYGFVPEEGNPGQLAITQLEFRHAGELGLPRIALLRTSVPNINLSDLLDRERNARLQAFRKEVGKALRPAEFADEAGLIHALSAGVQRALVANAAASKLPGAVRSSPGLGTPQSTPAGNATSPGANWWTALPSLLTGATAAITALAGFIALFVSPAKTGPAASTPPSAAAPASPPVVPAAPASREAPGEAGKTSGSQSVKTGDIGAGASVNIQQ